MKNRYRIVTDAYAGYEVQVKYWWFPLLWIQDCWVNTHNSVDNAEAFAIKRARRVVKEVVLEVKV